MTGPAGKLNGAGVPRAVAWHVRIEDANMSGDDWHSFTSWLERDGSHCGAYDEIVASDADFVALMGPTRAAIFRAANRAGGEG